jgi:hypothetical protein
MWEPRRLTTLWAFTLVKGTALPFYLLRISVCLAAVVHVVVKRRSKYGLRFRPAATLLLYVTLNIAVRKFSQHLF